jgi:hypothetical protein
MCATSPSGRKVHLLRWFIRFPTANPPRLADSDLPQTYRSKPLVQAEDESLFGELAILHYLRRDGWDGVWVDAFHSHRGRELFWQGMPDRVRPFVLSRVPHAYEMYRRILDMRGGKIGGFFDVLAWMGPRLLFVEYKGKDDFYTRSETTGRATPIVTYKCPQCGSTCLRSSEGSMPDNDLDEMRNCVYETEA